MATKTRFKSPSPQPAPHTTITLEAAAPPPPPPPPTIPEHSVSPLTILSEVSFSAAPPRTHTTQRRSELAILNHHNARPDAGPIVLPPSGAPPEAHNQSQHPNQNHNPILNQFSWPQTHTLPPPPSLPPRDQPRSLSIQSLISNPHEDRGQKRKGSSDLSAFDDRSSRGNSVSTTGLSLEDPDVRDAVEALGGLKADFTHPTTAPNSPPATVQQQQPLLSLLHSSAAQTHPLLSTALSVSTATYAASKSYIPPFRFVASAAETISARSGIEGYIRRGLTPSTKRRKPSTPPPPPAAAQGNELQSQQQQQPHTWHQKLYYTSTGLATSLSADSRKSLKYCLRILFAANNTLRLVITRLTDLLNELDRSPSPLLSEKIDTLKDEALKTLHQVVETISRYAGGALPEQARDVVKRQLLAFPVRWQKSVVVGEKEMEEKKRAQRVLAMAKEGLEMMRVVAEVMNGTLESAEAWCERLGRGGMVEEGGEEKTEMVEEKPGMVEEKPDVEMTGQSTTPQPTEVKQENSDPPQ